MTINVLLTDLERLLRSLVREEVAGRMPAAVDRVWGEGRGDGWGDGRGDGRGGARGGRKGGGTLPSR